MNTCGFSGCDRAIRAKGLCGAHYTQRSKGKALTPVRGDWRNHRPIEVRFFDRVRTEGDCWIWVGSRDAFDYGIFVVPEFNGRAHRWSYEFLRAEIPPGLHMDHLCRNRACVNPWHLEPTSARVNILRGVGRSAVHARQVECVHGHPFDAANTRIDPADGERICRACERERGARYRARKRSQLKETA